MSGVAWGGSEELWVKTAAFALKMRHDVTVSVYDWGILHPKLADLKEKGAKINLRKRIYFGGSTAGRIKGFIVKKIFSSRDILKLNNYKPHVIIISQGTIYECMSQEFIALQETTQAKMLIITQANSEYETLPCECFEVGRKLFQNATQLFFVSKRNETVAERQLVLKFVNSTVVSNPANLSKYDVCKWNESETVHLAFTGRLNSTVKGLGVLLEILSQERWKVRNWILNLYGSGEDENYLKALTKLYCLEKKVEFKGFVSQIDKVWEENHVLLMPSTLEGTPLSLIEAMLCGRTAVVSDVGGNAELISDDETGFVAEAPSVYSFGKALERMWMRKNELPEIGRLANKRIIEKVNLNDHENIINSVLSKE